MNIKDAHLDKATGGSGYFYSQQNADIESCLAKMPGSEFEVCQCGCGQQTIVATIPPLLTNRLCSVAETVNMQPSLMYLDRAIPRLIVLSFGVERDFYRFTKAATRFGAWLTYEPKCGEDVMVLPPAFMRKFAELYPASAPMLH